ncbi:MULTISPECIES: 2-dehydropantoate 2-reductase N-terminal domain-containing protein [Paenibacillus]|uniref:Ketopantoate reductase family protein n=1 Tax=Paenibacillus tianjinensis TaxID=2810347 RepID=A0ABX7LHC9_9BACL|nr:MULTISPECIES: 2-dehydropantoate 2-reductase N-terminal domain-containing protein [Paenibacillus]MDF9839652.1 2-dehydropantoate 2-reductase [Paenibacillus sp. PastF-2]MDF9846232.1 2-dehydropantoate 2-reductase [Paenibacillus sp. PastM-2]MDF9852805.1 2-dehydropantoate 2-reductase [Paenibacillus sp. PastF-1]MDH6477466.1 2-dehydropantoate 2-reductase [Paenibacillus sp. PastH-2]QSF47499.1 ketopantoate reductase family protein [Paenibacillus tianjinensis]
MKFLIYGAGVIGSIFAGKLASVGYNVTVLARNQRYEDMTANGIILQNAYSDRKEVSKVRVIDHLEPSDVYDYILVIMQKTQVNSVLPYLAKNQSENIVFVVNNPLGYDEWLKCIGQKRLMIGFPAAGGELKNGVVNYFIGRGIARAFQTTTFGELDGKTTSRLTALVKAFNRSHIPTVTSSNMDAWQKTHVALVTSIANALYIHKSNNYALSKSTKDIQLMIQGIKEGFQVIEALGYKVTPRKLHYFKLG